MDGVPDILQANIRLPQGTFYAEDLVWQALTEHVPDRLPAGHVLSVCANILSGTHPETKESVILVQPLVGNWGDPKQRPENKVLDDIKNGYITAGQAALYGQSVQES